jgi:MarR family transcriptional regulator, negative regulator of the multidrug operon emrRAB
MILRTAIILGRDLNARLDRLLKPAGLVESEYRVLMALFSYGGSAFAGELCKALAYSPANLTRVCNALVKRRLLARSLDAADRRKIRLSLEAAGEKLLRSLLPQISRNVAAAFDGFKVGERKHLLADLISPCAARQPDATPAPTSVAGSSLGIAACLRRTASARSGATAIALHCSR